MVPSSSGLSLRAARLSAAAATASAPRPAPQIRTTAPAAQGCLLEEAHAAQRTPRFRLQRGAQHPPYCASTSMLPVSGAEQFSACAQHAAGTAAAAAATRTPPEQPTGSGRGSRTAARTLRRPRSALSSGGRAAALRAGPRTEVGEPGTEAVLGTRRKEQIPQACAEPVRRAGRVGTMWSGTRARASKQMPHRPPLPSASAVRAWAN
jgi:hypothetical protein